MAISDDIARLKDELTSVRERISKIEHIKETEEGSSASRFFTKFTEIDKLEAREHKLMARLNTLEGYIG